MMKSLAATLLSILLSTLAPFPASADAPMFRWHDEDGTVHVSNVPDQVPADAEALVSEAPDATVRTTHAQAVPTSPARIRAARRTECAPADASGLVDAVATRLARQDRLAGLTLIVAGVPVSYDSDSVVQVVARDDASNAEGALEQAAIAYTSGGPCPARPPLPRYVVGGTQRATDTGVCDDYRRAMAQVGVTGNRNQSVARSFRQIARRFAATEARGYAYENPSSSAFTEPDAIVTVDTGAPRLRMQPNRVVLPPWVVEAHVAQTEEISDEANDLVEELTIALEEIDRAARAHRCW